MDSLSNKDRMAGTPRVLRHTKRCPQCGGNKLSTAVKAEQFIHGRDAAAVEISARVPVKTCGGCGFEFTDHAAEEIRHEAVCRHFSVMTPKQIRALRNRYNYSCEKFAELTGLGVASLRRWESGSLIQTMANDSYLRLLADPACMTQLVKMRGDSSRPATSEFELRGPLNADAHPTLDRILSELADLREQVERQRQAIERLIPDVYASRVPRLKPGDESRRTGTRGHRSDSSSAAYGARLSKQTGMMIHPPSGDAREN
jgi:putative zinc finger/helix-turn-helix YgiT family protein